MKPLVLIRTCVTNPAHFRQCTLTLESARIGFPTFDIAVHDTSPIENKLQVEMKARDLGLPYFPMASSSFHANWIRSCIVGFDHRRLIILDGDIIFYQSCEDWNFPDYHIAGMYIPKFMSEFSESITESRLHTSFLWINDTTSLRTALNVMQPLVAKHCPDYVPFNPFTPTYVALNNNLVFYDCCSQLYHALGGARFDDNQLCSYAHLNSASFYDTMMTVFSPKDQDYFARVHSLALVEPNKLRYLNKTILETYYAPRTPHPHSFQRL